MSNLQRPQTVIWATQTVHGIKTYSCEMDTTKLTNVVIMGDQDVIYMVQALRLQYTLV